jgi:cell division protein FtsA
MGKQNANLITGIDIGTAKTCAVTAEITDQGLRYRGHGVTESRGSRKGLIVELDKAVKSVEKAVELAENVAAEAIEHAVVGVGGPHIRGVNSQGGISLGSRPREIFRDDKRQAIERARAIALPADRQPLHLLPQEFIIDDQTGIHDPEGMVGRTIEVRVHIATASASATQNVVTTLNRAGVHVDDTVLEILAAADSVLRPEERELGVCLCDIGAGSTELIVFHEGAVVHTGVVPIGGDHFTNDIAVGLRTPLPAAEDIKRQFGCAVVTRIPEGSEIEVPSVGDRPLRLMQQRLLGEILEPRSQELFEMIRENLRAANVMDLCGSGLVLTGGGAKLPGLPEIVDNVLRWPTRVGEPSALPKMPAELAEPEYAVAIGLVLYAYRSRSGRPGGEPTTLGSRLKSFFAKKGN